MAVDDHGIETLKKSAEEMNPGDKSDYYHKVGLVSEGVEVSPSNPLPVSAGSGSGTSGQVNNISATTTAQTVAVPANAIGFLLESDSSNTDNIRWAIGATASASVGTLAEPGRDTGYIPLAAAISVIAIAGTQAVSVQWVLRP